MISDLLQQLRAEVEKASGMSNEDRSSLLGHLDAMTQCADTEAADKVKTQSSFQRLTSSLEQLEGAHPEITNMIGRIAVVLSNMGI